MGADIAPILIAADEERDRILAKAALEGSHLANPLCFVKDGVELLAYLRGEGPFAGRLRPALALLDLGAAQDGPAVLRAIKSDRELGDIPVAVLADSDEDRDRCRALDLGANAYVTKPFSFEKLAEVMRTLDHFGFSLVRP